MSPFMRKPVFRVPDQVLSKPGCTATEAGYIYGLEISDLGSRGIVLSHFPCSEKKDDDQLRGYSTADLHLCFCICKKHVFS